jgi:LacI family transcriptional regulator
MRATLTDIARQAGVSSATVDRVLNDRSGVREHTRAHVLSVAQRLGYVAGVAQAAAVRLHFLLPEGTNRFIATLHDQLDRQGAAREGVRTIVESIKGFDPPVLAERLRSLKGQTDGLGLVALDHPVVREAVRDLAQSGVRVVTLVSDIQNVPRIAYVGVDNRQAGRLAGYLMGRFLGAGCTGQVALFAGSLAYRGHQEREMGFRHILHDEYPGLKIVETREMLDDRAKARAEALQLLDRYPDLAAIYNVGGGTSGIGAALKERGRDRSVVLIGHEATASNKSLLLDGTLDALIDQNPRVEAREALSTLIAATNGSTYHPVPPRLHVVFRENLPDD